MQRMGPTHPAAPPSVWSAACWARCGVPAACSAAPPAARPGGRAASSSYAARALPRKCGAQPRCLVESGPFASTSPARLTPAANRSGPAAPLAAVHTEIMLCTLCPCCARSRYRSALGLPILSPESQVIKAWDFVMTALDLTYTGGSSILLAWRFLASRSCCMCMAVHAHSTQSGHRTPRPSNGKVRVQCLPPCAFRLSAACMHARGIVCYAPALSHPPSTAPSLLSHLPTHSPTHSSAASLMYHPTTLRRMQPSS